ncbi:hypothetical protein SBDP1_760040 [Syntrophobacter sp. SbD1]|nr:hypothetical protein SBDP1_760040 [Syntrophobacter sp. SbD1]
MVLVILRDDHGGLDNRVLQTQFPFHTHDSPEVLGNAMEVAALSENSICVGIGSVQIYM